MSRSRIRAVIEREPRRLSELEAAIGFPLARDAKTDDAWLLRRRNPVPEVDFVFAAFIGADLRRETDPSLHELRLIVPGVDANREAIEALGPGVREGGGTTRVEPVMFEWRRAGLLHIYEANPDSVFWKLHEPPFHPERSQAEENSLLTALATLLAGPVDEERIRAAFGGAWMSGVVPDRMVRWPTWRARIRPIEPGSPKSIHIELGPGLPLENLLAHLSLPEVLVVTSGVHQASARVVDEDSLRPLTFHGNRLDIEIDRAALSGDRITARHIPAQVAYSPGGALVTGLRIDVGAP